MVKPEIELKVGEIPPTRQADVGRGIVRIDTRAMRELGINPGDVVELEGTRKTVAVVETAYPSDVGLGIIRMDGLTRKNVGSSITEPVRVRRAELQEAKRVTIAPAQKGMMVQMPGNALNQLLSGRALMKGDIIQLKGTSNRGRGYISPFEEVFDIFESGPGLFGLADTKFIVTSVSPTNAAVKITDFTEIELTAEAAEVAEERIAEVTYEDVGGLKEEVRKIREMIELPLKHPELFERLGIKPPRGLLLHGPPGTGKTLVAKAVANETNAHFISVNGPEVMNKFVGEAEKKVRDVFKDAEDNAPSIIFIDEIDAIAPKRDESQNVEGRVVAQILSSMDGIGSRGQVVVIAATNRPNVLDEALRRTGRFDREIELGVPDAKGRKEILQIHTRNMPLKDVDLDRLAQDTHGFVGADLVGLCQEAAMNALRRTLPDFNLEAEGKIPTELLENLKVTAEDFEEGMKMVEPSAMRELVFEVPQTTWEDIGNLEKAKMELKETVEWPLRRAGDFKELGVEPPKGIILYGPPGTGKTLLAKAVAHETEANFISIKGPEILSKWVGDSPKKIREIFRKARQVAPCIIFFDEIDSIAPRRGTGVDGTHAVGEEIVNQILTEMDGLEELRGVIIIAASNRPDLIDLALLRPGRFDRYVHVPAPDKEGRKDIFRVHISKMGRVGKDVDIDKLAEMTDNYTGADIAKIAREAAMAVMRVLDDAEKPERLEARFKELKKRADDLEREAKEAEARSDGLMRESEKAVLEIPKNEKAIQDLKNHADKEHIQAKQLAMKARDARHRAVNSGNSADEQRARDLEDEQQESEARAEALAKDVQAAERTLARNKRIVDESKKKADFELARAEKANRKHEIQLALLEKVKASVAATQKGMSPKAKEIFKEFESGKLSKDFVEKFKTVRMEHFVDAVKKTNPTLNEKVIEFYKAVERSFEADNPALKKSSDDSLYR